MKLVKNGLRDLDRTLESAPESAATTAVLDIIRERPGLESEIISLAAELVGDRELAINALRSLEEQGLILIDREHSSGQLFIMTLS